MGRLAISITVSGVGALYGRNLAGLIELARIADDLGIDQIAVPDHLAIGSGTERYPYGRYPLPPDEPFPEPLVLLASMASATRRIRLATGVLIAPLRPPLLLAKMAATLDALSGGRLDLGVGVGWQREEFAGSGVAFEQRWRRLDETLRACRALWRDDPSGYAGRDLAFEGLRAFPKPPTRGPRVWLGLAATPVGVRRIAEHADGWMPMESGPEAIASGLASIRRAFGERGRLLDGFAVRAHAPLVRRDRRPDLDATLAGLGALADAGATHVGLALGAFCREREQVRPFLEAVSRSAER